MDQNDHGHGELALEKAPAVSWEFIFCIFFFKVPSDFFRFLPDLMVLCLSTLGAEDPKFKNIPLNLITAGAHSTITNSAGKF